MGSATLSQLTFLGESDLNFHGEIFPLGQQGVKKEEEKKEEGTNTVLNVTYEITITNLKLE